MAKPISACSIAGSDSGSGAGIQADLKTMTAIGVFGTTAVTALTAQNTQGVQKVQAISANFVRAQLDSLLADFNIRAAKTGMLPDHDVAGVVSETIIAASIPLVVDPVMIATSGDTLVSDATVHALSERLFPKAVLITPNRPEAAFLLGRPVNDEAPQDAAKALADRFGTSVLLKGGDAGGERVVDVLAAPSGVETFESQRFYPGQAMHGTGCTLSSAITAYLAMGHDLLTAVTGGRTFVLEAIKNSTLPGDGARVLRIG